MKSRLRIATAAIVLSFAALTACGDSDEPAPIPSETAAPSEGASASAPATSGVPEQASDLVGDWEDLDARWVVHFRADGTYVEDYEGVKDFRVGEYTLESGTVTLEGGDGNADEGEVDGETLVFQLGTLKRVAASSSDQ